LNPDIHTARRHLLAIERLETNATAREGVLRRERELLRTVQRERDALRDAALALVALYQSPSYDPTAVAAWAALRAALTPTPTETR